MPTHVWRMIDTHTMKVGTYRDASFDEDQYPVLRGQAIFIHQILRKPVVASSLHLSASLRAAPSTIIKSAPARRPLKFVMPHHLYMKGFLDGSYENYARWLRHDPLVDMQEREIRSDFTVKRSPEFDENGDPTSISAARKSSWPGWLGAMRSEWQQQKNNGTFNFVPRAPVPTGTRTLTAEVGISKKTLRQRPDKV